jgi:GNAT superfamily N-acetyltransferase
MLLPTPPLGRLAVDRAWQGRGLGAALLACAACRAAPAAPQQAAHGGLLHDPIVGGAHKKSAQSLRLSAIFLMVVQTT